MNKINPKTFTIILFFSILIILNSKKQRILTIINKKLTTNNLSQDNLEYIILEKKVDTSGRTIKGMCLNDSKDAIESN